MIELNCCCSSTSDRQLNLLSFLLLSLLVVRECIQRTPHCLFCSRFPQIIRDLLFTGMLYVRLLSLASLASLSFHFNSHIIYSVHVHFPVTFPFTIWAFYNFSFSLVNVRKECGLNRRLLWWWHYYSDDGKGIIGKQLYLFSHSFVLTGRRDLYQANGLLFLYITIIR